MGIWALRKLKSFPINHSSSDADKDNEYKQKDSSENLVAKELKLRLANQHFLLEPIFEVKDNGDTGEERKWKRHCNPAMVNVRYIPPLKTHSKAELIHSWMLM